MKISVRRLGRMDEYALAHRIEKGRFFLSPPAFEGMHCLPE